MANEHRVQASRALGALLHAGFETYHSLTVRVVREAGFGDVTPAQALVIAHMEGAPMRAVDLAAKVGVSKQALSVMAKALARKGYLNYLPDREDGRAKRLDLTEKGRRLKQTGGQARTRVEAMIAARLGERDNRLLIDLLRRLTGD